MEEQEVKQNNSKLNPDKFESLILLNSMINLIELANVELRKERTHHSMPQPQSLIPVYSFISYTILTKVALSTYKWLQLVEVLVDLETSSLDVSLTGNQKKMIWCLALTLAKHLCNTIGRQKGIQSIEISVKHQVGIYISQHPYSKHILYSINLKVITNKHSVKININKYPIIEFKNSMNSKRPKNK